MTLILSIIAAYMLSYGYYGINSFAFGGELWGMKIQASKPQQRYAKICKIFLIVGIIGTVVFIIPNFITLIRLLFEVPLLVLIFLVVWIASFFVGAIFSKKKGSSPKLGEDNDNLLVLGELDLIKTVEGQLNEAKYFYVDNEGISLINAQNYCYAVERYENHRLGYLNDNKQVALVAGYFEQKYKSVFEYKSQFERINPTPGKIVTIVGTGGVAFVHEPGTKYQANFQGILATRK